MSDKGWNSIIQVSLVASGLGVLFMLGCKQLEYDTQTKTAIVSILGTLVTGAVAKYFTANQPAAEAARKEGA